MKSIRSGRNDGSGKGSKPSGKAGAKKDDSLTTSKRAPVAPVHQSHLNTEWTIESDSAIVSKMSDAELQRAKQAFFEMDKDSSGYIDRDELAFMLKTLGHSPTEEELVEMLGQAEGQSEGGDGNGKIDLREFLKWYAKTLRDSNDNCAEDILDAYRALGGSADHAMEKAQLRELLIREYDLDIDIDEIFDGNGAESTLPLEEFKRMLAEKKKDSR